MRLIGRLEVFADKNIDRMFWICGLVIPVGIVVHHWLTGFNGIW